MSTIVCPHCGQVHRQGARFCPLTGKQIEQAAGVAVSQEGGAGLTGKMPPNSLLLGRYVILRKIGQGGMAAVYQAADKTQPGTLWAIKEMSDAAIPDDADRNYAVQAFQQEANLLRRLDHPNLPKVAAAFTDKGKHYLVMEFVPGQTLAAILESRKRPFSEAEVLPWAFQLCDVLIYLHSQSPKIIFRDLKPGNIMLVTENRIKLIDFGIARFFKPGQTKDTLALGTPGFAAPEAVSGQTDERSDIYSLCVTLHHLLTLHDPILTLFNLPAVRLLNATISAEMEGILARGLQNRRENRWRNVFEMEAELARLASKAVPQTVDHNLSMAATLERRRPVPGVPLPIAQAPPVIQPASNLAATFAQQAPPVQAPSAAPLMTSRPTTRLVAAAARLTGRQLVLIFLPAFLAVILAAWLLAPVLDELPVDWNKVPVLAFFAPLCYAAFPRRGVAFVGQLLFSLALVITVWVKLGTQGYSWANLTLASLLSAAFMEVWAAFLPRIKGEDSRDAWVREAGWLAAMGMLGTILFFGLVTLWRTGLDPLQWFMGAVFGLLGWFLGDLLQQAMLYRRTGLRRMPR